jgi:hypothetical protein
LSELPIQRLLLEVVAVPERLKIVYAVMGGFAVRTWGIPRPTYDADLAVAVDEARLGPLLTALEALSLVVDEKYKRGNRDFIAGFAKITAAGTAGGTTWNVDLFLARGALMESALSRSRTASIGDRPVRVVAPEDLILFKLLAFRRKDQLDVEEVLKVSSTLDHAYLKDWADQLGVASRLKEFLN